MSIKTSNPDAIFNSGVSQCKFPIKTVCDGLSMVLQFVLMRRVSPTISMSSPATTELETT